MANLARGRVDAGWENASNMCNTTVDNLASSCPRHPHLLQFLEAKYTNLPSVTRSCGVAVADKNRNSSYSSSPTPVKQELRPAAI